MSKKRHLAFMGIVAGGLALVLAGCAGSSGESTGSAAGSANREAAATAAGLRVNLTNETRDDIYYTYYNWDGASDCCGKVLLNGVLKPGQSVQRSHMNSSIGRCDLMLEAGADRWNPFRFIGVAESDASAYIVNFGTSNGDRVNCTSLPQLSPGSTQRTVDQDTDHVYEWTTLPPSGSDMAVVDMVVRNS